MIRSEYITELQSSVDKVWKVVTDNTNSTWRTDLAEIKIENSSKFIEITKQGYETEFEITLSIPYDRYEFDIKNSNMTGHFTGIFEKKNGRTVLKLIEEVSVKNVLMRLFAKGYLKKQQKCYVRDLKKALGE